MKAMDEFLRREAARRAALPKLYWAIDPQFVAADRAAALEFLAALRADPRTDRAWLESFERMRVGICDRGLSVPVVRPPAPSVRDWVRQFRASPFRLSSDPIPREGSFFDSGRGCQAQRSSKL